MAEFKVKRVEQGRTKIRNVPIAVTPEGFWCCPSPAVFQKNLNTQNHHPKQKRPSPPRKTASKKKQNHLTERRPLCNRHERSPSRSRVVSNDQKCLNSDGGGVSPSVVIERLPKPKVDNLQQQPQRLSVEFGELETSDLQVVLWGRQGVSVKLKVHRDVLVRSSSFFADKLSQQSPLPCLEIGDCEDVEIFTEIIGLMYCKDLKQRLIKQTVPRILRILKVSESLGFNSCLKLCLEYLEAVPWVGEEEDKVVATVLRLRADGMGVRPVLRRVSSEITRPPNDILTHILQLVIKSNEERGRREMKSLVLKLLRENNLVSSSSFDSCNKNIYSSCRNCLDSLLLLFRQAAEPGFTDKSMDCKGPVVREISLMADNLLWLTEILADRQVGDEFVLMWASQNELAMLHSKLPIVSRHLVSCVTARLFVGIGRGEMLPSQEIRHLLLQTWFQPLIDDYSWLQHACRSFDRKTVEEGIGRTILTLPLEDQQSILLTWLDSFLKSGDSCPNLQRAFEVWWRRTFTKPHLEHGNLLRSQVK